ncbi:acyl carrier protein [Mycoplasma enhydrae]|uniref:acyl carrier protein n=1 Tax=Mycoplasma enhydrae TaxID=2499220 RepID=UPI00197B351E|nr:acyl carrier protein [Mycoplasma enhydrae]MBN4089514.1 acyl carrier protein [Mycoplasma enhydrae]MCV3733641.1 acyl carrier protein [Mycoplasma enhydrae]MCV3753378.1 acyl carrier protein [Mycoplasma enhydrae]
MNSKDILFKEIKKYTKNNFDLNTNIKELGIDSLDLVILISDLETKLKIEISDEELIKLKTLDDIVKIIDQKQNNEKK